MPNFTSSLPEKTLKQIANASKKNEVTQKQDY